MFGLPTPLLVIGGCLAVGALGMLGALFLWGKTVKDNKGTFFQDHVMPLLAETGNGGDLSGRDVLDSDFCQTEHVPGTAYTTLLERMTYGDSIRAYRPIGSSLDL